MEPVHEEERHGLKIKIMYDQDAQGPAEDHDENLFLVGYHRDFSVSGPRHSLPKDQWKVSHKSVCQECGQRNFTTVEETGNKCGKCGKAARVNKDFYSETRGACLVSQNEVAALLGGKQNSTDYEWPAELAKKYHVFALEAYIHSGVRLALSREGNFPDRQWDVSQLGAVFVAKKEWRRRDSARKAALGLIQYWNDALSGNVYGYIVETFSDVDEEGEDIDSCWGFFGDYDAKGGALEEARAAVDRITSKGKTDHTGQLTLPLA
jgi:hypothetical protein